MKIGVPSEIKAQESRVGLTPQSVKELVKNKHKVLIQKDAGIGAGFSNSDYELSGAKIVNSAEDIFNDSEMIVKVKEPLMNEVAMIRENQILFTLKDLDIITDIRGYGMMGGIDIKMDERLGKAGYALSLIHI